uniref:TIL domain-containing protein n=1 Tax=Anopheles quadriannulatus TaxID=34691 RepID=A0A182WWB5_ANOQN
MQRALIILVIVSCIQIQFLDARKNCGRNEVYSECHSQCQPKCGDRLDGIFCTKVCVRGCGCKSGYAKKGNACVRYTKENRCVKVVARHGRSHCAETGSYHKCGKPHHESQHVLEMKCILVAALDAESVNAMMYYL